MYTSTVKDAQFHCSEGSLYLSGHYQVVQVWEWMGERDITCSDLSYVASRSISKITTLLIQNVDFFGCPSI